jgi:protein-S-isoprenylcysteine O-methyltransferase Ste14
MKALHYTVGGVWLVFWTYWLASARGVKPTLNARYTARTRLGLWVPALLVVRLWHPSALEIRSVTVGVIGLGIVLCGLALAIWARLYLGRNWGMPMSVKEDPELITSGPYSRVRHPIYTGLLLGFLGTTLLTNVVTVVVFLGFGASFLYSAVVEERNMTKAFPAEYPAYRTRTKMLIPFVL